MLGRGLFAPPVFEDEGKSARAAALWSILWPCIGLTLAWTAIAIACVPEAWWRVGPHGVALLVTCFGVLAIARRGYCNEAAALLIAMVCLIGAASAWTGGGTHGAPYNAFAAPIMLTGILLGGRAAGFVTAFVFAFGGALVWSERMGFLPAVQEYELHALSLWLGSGLVFGAIAIFQRLAARMARQGLQRVQAYRDIFEAAAVGLVEMDLSALQSAEQLEGALDRMILRHANGEARRLLGLPESGALARPLSQSVAKLTSTGELVHGATGITQRVFLLEPRAGTPRYVRWSMRWPDAPDDRAKVAVSLDDVTAQRELEEHLRQLQRLEAIGKLAGGVAHDFNNLLTVIAGHSALLRKRAGADPRFQDDVVAIQDTTARGVALTRQLLTFSRQEVHRPEVVSIDPLIAGLQNLLARLIGEDVALELALSALGASVRIDPSHVEQIVMNLVVNARDAMPQGGTLRVETQPDAYAGVDHRAEHGYVRISVSDTGIGMDEGTRRRAFEPFFTTKKLGQGTGLGLATVHGIVERAAGRVAISTKLGAGTRIDVWLPRTIDRRTEPTHSQVKGLVPARDATLLVVEDQESVRNVVRALLEDRGYTVRVAASPEHAIELAGLARVRIDAVLTDVVMPTLDGRQLAERLREQRPGLPIVFMSGYAADVLVRHGIERDAVPYVEKPFTPDKLVGVIETVLDAARRKPAVERSAG